jgi:hypothetical protein
VKSFSYFSAILSIALIVLTPFPWSLACLIFVPAVFLQSYSSILNRIWFYVGICLAWLFQPVFLMFFYALVITPFGFVLWAVRRKTPTPTWQTSRKNQRFDRMF